MFEEMNMIVLSGKEYPMKCDNLVLEKIQDKYEDLGKYENMLNGFVPELDEYGEEVRNEDGLLVGHYKMPDIKIINEAAVCSFRRDSQSNGKKTKRRFRKSVIEH